MSDTFDAAVFEQMVIDQANETKTTPVPVGDYEAMIDKVRVKSVKLSKGDRAGTEVPILEVTFHIDDDKVAEQLNRDKVLSRMDIWLDVEGGALAVGPNKNVRLGRLREAVGMNKPGKSFSFMQLEGAGPVKVQVNHRTVNEDVYDEVVGVAAA